MATSMVIVPTVTAGAVVAVASPAALPTSEVDGAIRYSQSDDTLYTFDGTSWSPVAGGGGSGITQLTGDVTAGPGSGSQAATVVSVGGQSAANVAAATVLANAATSANTASTIVRRDASGNFIAGTITAALTGTASGNPPNSRTISTTAPLAGGGDLSANRTLSIPVATNSVDGYLSAADHTSFAAKQAAGNYITDLTGDVTASGPGSAAATVASVGGTAASFIASGANLANGASASNTGGVIVRRDGIGNFTASTITAALTGTASGNIVTLSGDVTTPGAGSGVSTLASVGTAGTYVKVTTDAKGRVISGSASPQAIADGGSGQTTANAALNAFLPSQATHAGQFLTTDGTNTSWATAGSSITSYSVAYASVSTALNTYVNLAQSAALPAGTYLVSHSSTLDNSVGAGMGAPYLLDITVDTLAGNTASPPNTGTNLVARTAITLDSAASYYTATIAGLIVVSDGVDVTINGSAFVGNTLYAKAYTSTNGSTPASGSLSIIKIA